VAVTRKSFICLGCDFIPGCGRVLTDEERHYYDRRCEDCTRAWDEAIDSWRLGEDNHYLDRLFSDTPPTLN
jgi:hypothetical protein